MNKVLLVCLLGLSMACQAQTPCPPQELHILTQDGKTQIIQAEVACTPQQRAWGFQERTYIPPQTGMLFVVDKPQQFVMWMKNTQLPLDMLFIDKNGTIADIRQGAPYSLDLIYGPEDMCAVLEINANEAANLGIKVGDRFKEEIFCLDKTP